MKKRIGNSNGVCAPPRPSALKVGAIGVNCWSPLDANLPWGGVKGSELGREGGLAGALAYTEEKVVTVLLPCFSVAARERFLVRFTVMMSNPASFDLLLQGIRARRLEFSEQKHIPQD